MSYLILQIILFLIGAAFFGVAFGWIMARRDLDARVREEREARNATVADWQSRHQEALDLADAARSRIASLESDLDVLRGELYAKSERTLQLENRVEQGVTERRGLEAGLSGRVDDFQRLRDELDAANEQINRARLAVSDKDVIIGELQKGLAERDKQISSLHSALSARDEETRAAQQLAANLERTIHSRDARIASLEENLASRATPGPLFAAESNTDPASTPSPTKDDSKRIRRRRV